jgi:hypothetical protein
MRRALALVPLLASCAAVRPLTASNADLVDHRAVVLARDEGQRLRRAHEYLERHPKGAWAEDVHALFDREEPSYYRACKKSRSAAVDYLAWLPQGPHAEAAASLLLSFDEHEPQDEKSRMLRAAQKNEERLERAAEERQAAESIALEALRVALDPSAYGRKLEEDGGLTRYLLAGTSFGATPSARTRSRTFTIPTRASPLERTLEVTLRVLLDDGGAVTAVEIYGPALFARMAEASTLRVASPAEADRYARDVVETMRRAAGASLHVEWRPDLVRIRGKK